VVSGHSADLHTLLTTRLRLRPPRIADFDQSLALWQDPAVTRFIGGQPHTREAIWARLLRYIGHWQALGFGYWVVETIEDGTFVGEVGLADYRRDTEPSFEGTPEAGWVLSPTAQGQGFASEAATAALAWRDTNLPGTETVAIIEPDHAASLRIAEKLGFEEDRVLTYHGSPIILLRRLSVSRG
jgi:RimJ/RimL family protein N-acetyltransferase